MDVTKTRVRISERLISHKFSAVQGVNEVRTGYVDGYVNKIDLMHHNSIEAIIVLDNGNFISAELELLTKI